MPKNKGPTPQEISAQIVAALAKKSAAKLIRELISGNEEEQLRAAQAFTCGGSLPCFEVAVSPFPLVEDAIGPLVALLSQSCSDGQKEAAANALHSLTSKVANVFDPRETPVVDTVVRVGGIEPIIALARDGTATQREHAAGVLHNLANTMANRTAIAEAGGVEVLIALARDGSGVQMEHAAFALGSLGFHHATNRAAIIKAGGVEVISRLSREGTPIQQSIAMYALGNLSKAHMQPL